MFFLLLELFIHHAISELFSAGSWEPAVTCRAFVSSIMRGCSRLDLKAHSKAINKTQVHQTALDISFVTITSELAVRGSHWLILPNYLLMQCSS